MKSTLTIKLQCSSRDQRSKSGRDGSTPEKDHCAFSKFILCVPSGQGVETSWYEATFREAYEETSGVPTARILDEGLETFNDPPDDHL